MADETIEKTFTVTPPARLMISNIRGSITILAGESGVIRVTAVKHSSFNSERDDIEIAQEPDGSVRVETRSRDGMFGLISHPPKVDYTVQVPQEIHLDASGVSSTLKVSGLTGIFKCRTVSGDVSLADLSGPFKINVVSGDVTGSHLEGPLEVEAVSGDVRLMESVFPSADASTVSGDLILQTALADGPYQFGTVSGNVRLVVPGDTHCNAELKSVSGNIKSSFPATNVRIGHGLKMTHIQGGGVAVRLKSVSGSLSIETEGVPPMPIEAEKLAPAPGFVPTPPTPPIPPASPFPSDPGTPPPNQLSTAEILQRIERGEMTVDEAIRLMKEQP